jgi:hypothetical protein
MILPHRSVVLRWESNPDTVSRGKSERGVTLGADDTPSNTPSKYLERWKLHLYACARLFFEQD